MPRLIDASALLEKLKRTPRYFNIKFDIEEAPTVDAVEVVRCKDCKYSYGNKYCTNDQWEDECALVTIKADDFCSYGERKDNG